MCVYAYCNQLRFKEAVEAKVFNFLRVDLFYFLAAVLLKITYKSFDVAVK